MSLVRKMSESSAVAPVFPVKPCLKRRSSVPANNRPPTEVASSVAVGEGEGRLRHGSCDSLDNNSSSLSLSDSSYGSSFGSKKSVSFADSVGEDLCRVKLFRKELCELTLLQEDSGWPAKMWRWQQCQQRADWYLGGEDEDQEQQEFLDEMYDDFDEEFFSTEEALPPPAPLTNQEREVAQMDAALSCLRMTADPPSSIEPTFVQPRDMPNFEVTGVVCLEAVSVLPDQSMLSGTVRVTCDGRVGVRYSTDGWATSEDVSATAFGEERYGFIIGTAGMKIGDDLELVAYLSSPSEKVWEDDNGGLKYRFICKSRAKFRPGKSLW